MRAYLKSHGLIYSKVKVQSDPMNRMSRATKEKDNGTCLYLDNFIF